VLHGRDVRIDKLLALAGHGGSPASLYTIRRGLFGLPADAPLFSQRLLRDWGERREQFVNDAEIESNDPPGQAQTVLEMRNYLLNTLLRDTDVMAMRHGLEVRVPLLDTPLVEFVLSLPLEMRVRRGVAKPLLAEALDIPPQKPAKLGFTLPFVQWLRGPMRAEVQERLAALSHAGPYLHPPAVSRLFRRFLEGEDRLWPRVWSLYVLDRWLERVHLRVPVDALSSVP
jgi:asparagine synthase (glutamine-hydrolysing)